jgi:hypothetical protein
MTKSAKGMFQMEFEAVIGKGQKGMSAGVFGAAIQAPGNISLLRVLSTRIPRDSEKACWQGDSLA